MSDPTGRPIQGIHHVTAIAGPPQENVDFYAGVLGLRLVKRTVNFDDPSTFHFYYGDEVGGPGSILTFFPWAHVARGRPGAGAAVATAYSVRASAIEAWRARLAERGVPTEAPADRLGDPVLSFEDPHGLAIELVGDADEDLASPVEVSSGAGASALEPLVGFHGVTLSVTRAEETARLLTDVFGYEAVGEADEGRSTRLRFRSPSGSSAGALDLLRDSRSDRARMGSGSVHHVAFRASDEQEQLEWREAILKRGFQVTPVLDRQYFKSIYFREPSGVLFEVATDPPGFTLDESPEELGSGLRLPPWLEPRREWIEARLPRIEVPRRPDPGPGSGAAPGGDLRAEGGPP